jgi:hypothetical protein
MKGLDFGFTGSNYEPPNPFQDLQRSINYYMEFSGDPASKMPGTLLGCPGKSPIDQLATVGEVRGAWVLPGGTQTLWVSGNTLFLQTLTVPATQTSIAQFTVTTIGTLLTNSGHIVIRDNGAGGYAVIVDGPYGYYYRLDGASSFQFTGGVAIGSSTVTWPATVPTQLIVGSLISAADGAIPAGTTITDINVVAGSLTISSPSTGTNATDGISVTLAQFGRITDPNFLGADRVDFIDGWLLFNQPNSQNIYTNAPVPYTLIFQGAFYSKKDSGSDNVVTHMAHNREWWVIGERQSEVWDDTGQSANFGFTRFPGVAPQVGCAAKHSIARLGDSLVWLARSERGENVVVRTNQYSFESISDHGVEHAITSYPYVADAIGFTYEEEGHLFYVLTFPTADATWCYDLTSSIKAGVPCWHQRASYDTATGTYHRDRANCFVNFQDLRLVGDYQSGQIHRLSRTIYTDAGAVLRASRRAPHVWSRTDRGRLFYASLQVEFSPGVGLSTGQGVNPQVMLRQSNDAGQSWGSERWTTVGKIGQTKNRAIWRKLGFSRDTVFEVSFSDPVNRDIVGATLFVTDEFGET